MSFRWTIRTPLALAVFLGSAARAIAPEAATLPASYACPGGGTDCCVPYRALCVAHGRFRVTVVPDQRPTGTELTPIVPGREQAEDVALSDAAGYFWFSRPSLPDVAVKILDRCAASGRHVLFASSLTLEPFTLTVTEVATGEVWTHRSEGELFALRASLAGCPIPGTGEGR